MNFKACEFASYELPRCHPANAHLLLRLVRFEAVWVPANASANGKSVLKKWRI